MALPMRQCSVSKQAQDRLKPAYEDLFKKLLNATQHGLPHEPIPRPLLEDNEEIREANLERLWDLGGFNFTCMSHQNSIRIPNSASILVSNYQDIYLDRKSNEAVYAFWRTKVGERIKDPKKRALLAPVVPPHVFGGKRPSLEQRFYEVLSQNNVDLVDTKATPILEIHEHGLKTSEKDYEFDVLIFATGSHN